VPDDPEDFAIFEREADAVKRHEAVKVFCQVAGSNHGTGSCVSGYFLLVLI
jgi:hypothetical protein